MAPIKIKCAQFWDSGVNCEGKSGVTFKQCKLCSKDRIVDSRNLNKDGVDIGYLYNISSDGSEHWYYSIERP
ncbi:unnamed protein product [Fusarium venenatum]|uniref:Uncharacterized protein n=1 Tax=Fusarium venenatum TaxID=56646 RepID=A0A2L2TU86_9HYPO|nr:uncharacterized protein FVRRES_00267 [Fusarium venenatum]CEI63755.1 unnamed protein product [Fusarium venenatum]